MRVGADSEDARTQYLLQFLDVFLDGVRLDRVLLADEEDGMVVQHVTALRDGIPEGAETREIAGYLGVVLRGKVVIRDTREKQE